METTLVWPGTTLEPALTPSSSQVTYYLKANDFEMKDYALAFKVFLNSFSIKIFK